MGRRYGDTPKHIPSLHSMDPCILWIFPEKNIGAVHTAAHVRISEVITLGSRQSLCINQSLRSRARGAGHLNDLCRQGIPARWKHRKNMFCFYYIQPKNIYIYSIYCLVVGNGNARNCCHIFTYTMLLEVSDLGLKTFIMFNTLDKALSKGHIKRKVKVVSIRNPTFRYQNPTKKPNG